MQNQHRKIASRLTGLVALLFSTTAQAQVPPELGYVYPPVVKAGTTTDVQLGGYDFTSDMQFFVHDPRVKLTPSGELGDFLMTEPPFWFGPKSHDTALPIPREISARIEVPPDMPAGLVKWQVANANGSSATGVFYISHLAEVLEQRRGEQPQVLPTTPIAVSGRLAKIAEVDRYEFTAQRDGLITLDLMARRLGAKFHGAVKVHDAKSRLVADVADTAGSDIQATFVARGNESYTASVYDVDFRGNPAFVYRLAFQAGPRVVATLPAMVQKGRQQVAFIGSGLTQPGGTLESITATVDVPDHATDHVIHSLKTALGEASIKIGLSELDEQIEQAAPMIEGSAGKSARKLLAPGAVTGTLSEPSESDRYTFDAAKGEVWKIAIDARAFGSPLDVALDIEDATGKILTTNDDLPDSVDAALDFTAPADGAFTCVVRDVAGQSGSLAAIYRLSLERRQPGFSLTTDQRVTVPIGGKAVLTVKVARHAGFKDEIRLRLEGLPKNLTAPTELIVPAGKNVLKISLEAGEQAAAHATMIQVVGTAKIGEQTFERKATAVSGGNLCPRSPAENQIGDILLTTTIKPPVKLQLVDRRRQRAVHRGTTYPAPFMISRDEGFLGEVRLQMAAKQSRHRMGIRGPVLVVPPEADRTLYPCFMPEWLETDRTSRMTVMGVTEVADAQGHKRQVTFPADYRVTMILEGALLKLAHQADELTVGPGQSFDVPLQISRSRKFARPVDIELVVPRDLAGLLKADSLRVPADQNTAVVTIQTADDSALVGDWEFKIKATGMQEEKWPVVSEINVPVRFVQGLGE